jgi:hypothetical protein
VQNWSLGVVLSSAEVLQQDLHFYFFSALKKKLYLMTVLSPYKTRRTITLESNP